MAFEASACPSDSPAAMATTATTTPPATPAATPMATRTMTPTTERCADCSSAKKQPKDLLSLPHEIQALIISYVIRPTDLVTVCLTSKALHKLAVVELYKEVTLEVGSHTDTRLTAFINPNNIGLKHLKKLDLYLAEHPEKCATLVNQANLAIRMLIEFLPEHQLEKFSWHPWTPFSADNLKLLYKKQKNMKWLEGISLDRNVLPELEKEPTFDELFQNVRKLGLYPDNRDVLQMSGALVKRSKKLEKITLHASFDDDSDGPPISSRELNDSATAPGLITTTIFGHLMPFETCQPMALTDFTLQKINLRYAADTYCQFVDFRNLKALRIFACSGADSLLAQLCKATKLPEKLETLEFKHDDNPENDGLTALDGFLCLVSGVKTLTLDFLYCKQMPDSAGIVRHGNTLQELNVHASRGDAEEEELVYYLEDFEKICKACSSLEQLSMAFPPTSLIRPSNDAFQAFENALGDLPQLVTLNITTWPNNSASTSRPPLPRKTYEVLLQALAQSGFEHAISHAAVQEPPRQSKLAIIAFGASDKVYDREDSKNQIIFTKGKQIDAFGKESPLAVQVGWCLRKYVVPNSDILDFSLARSTLPPTREPPRSEDSDAI